MAELFEKAKVIGLQHVKDWLPNGRQDGDEWVALNPTRADEHAGSFKVNLSTGAWGDFATNDEGGDAVSLYAYLNYAECENLASTRGYRNVSGGIQAEAARKILTQYDPSYFPGSEDNFKPAKGKSGDVWAGWSIVERGIAAPPSLDLTWYEGKWGKHEQVWDFFTAKGVVCLKVVRFRKEGKKDDRPFTVWTKSGEYKWRAKALQGPYPLYNRQKLESEQTAPILLVEGQKAAAEADRILGDRFVCTTWYGGTKAFEKTDTEPLVAREVFFWFDADFAGRSVVKKLRDLDVKLHLVYPPTDTVKGWDIADAIAEGWSAEKLLDHINAGNGGDEEAFVDDENAFRFKILGYSGEQIVFYPFGSRKITRFRASSLSKGVMMTLMDRSRWGQLYQREDGGIAWDAAVNDLLRRAEEKPVFNQACIRGAGAWNDQGRVIVNTGEYLIDRGERRELYEADGDFVYERGRFAPYNVGDPVTTEEAARLPRMLESIEWENVAHSAILAGWLLLSPFGGALRWRPHVWMTGPKGSGKSWVLENITYPMCGHEFGVMGYGTSTPAGIRDSLGNSAVSTQMDEMESDNPKYAEYIDQNLKLFREGSSGKGLGAATLHGTQDGEGRQWHTQSMALFASIGAGLRHGADRSRFTTITIRGARGRPIAEREQQFRTLQDQAGVVTRAWARAFHCRTFRIIDETLDCITAMTAQATDVLGNRRDGDQLGTLLAGAWMIEHDRAATAAECREYLESIKLDRILSGEIDKPDEELVLDELLASRIEITDGNKRTRPTIGTALQFWYWSKGTIVANDEAYDFPAADADRIKRELEQIGLKPVIVKNTGRLQIACGHPAIRQLLKDTAWGSVYEALLTRLPFCEDRPKGPSRFAGIAKRFLDLDIREIFDGVPF